MDDLMKKLGTLDAKVRADEFCKMYPEMDNELMFCWFANAIEMGRDSGYHKAIKTLSIEEFEEKKKLYKDVGLID